MAQSEIRKRELHRIRSWISSHEKRGYYVPNELRESLPNLSTQKLKALTSDKLYEQVTYITAEGEEKGGKQGRYIERQQRAKKAVETRKANKASARKFFGGDDLGSTKKDTNYNKSTPFGKINPETGEYDEKQAEKFVDPKTGKFVEPGQVILDNLRSLIGQYPTNGAKYLENLLNSEITRYGEKKVAQALAQIPEEEIYIIQQVVFYVSREVSGADVALEVHEDLRRFAEILKGSILTLDEAKEAGRTMDMD